MTIREYLCDILENKKIVGFNKMNVLDVREPGRCKDFRKLDRLQISQSVQSFHSGACGVSPKHSLRYVLALESHKRRTANVREVVLMFTHRRGNAQYLCFWRGVRCKTCESPRMSNHSCIRPWLVLSSESRSRFAYLSITSNMLTRIGVTVDWRQRHRVCLKSKVMTSLFYLYSWKCLRELHWQ